MTITVNDIQLLESERLTDQPNGGGRMTGSVVDGGQVNNLFADISRLDRTYGDVALRKAFMAIRSANTDPYLGAHVIVTSPPADERVATTLFTTNSPVDERVQAQNRIESYVTRGPLAEYYLFGNQPEGAKAITLLGRVEAQLPEVGSVLVLSVENGSGVVSTEQYVRIADVKAENRVFTYDQGSTIGEYTRKVVTVTLTSKLRQTFFGAEASPYSNVSVPTRVRTTTLADASRYYGITRLHTAAAQDALEVYVDSVFSQLVPSTQREVPFVDARPGLTLNFIAIGAPRTVTHNTYYAPAFFGRGILPRSITGGLSAQGSIISDDGLGNVSGQSGDIGDVDYEAGRLSGDAGQAFNSLTFTPAVAVQRNAYTQGVSITLSNQGTVHTATMARPVGPKTLRVDYRYLGKWYTLVDRNGDGTLSGAAAGEGSGTVNYATGAVVVTLGAFPDLGSMLIYSYGQNTDFTQRAGTAVATTPVVEGTLSYPPDGAVGATFSWLSGGMAKTATADPSGTIAGDGSGTLSYRDGFYSFAPAANAWPDSNSQLTIQYTRAIAQTGQVSGAFAGTTLTFALPADMLPVKPGGLRARVPVTLGGRGDEIWLKDDGAGGIVAATARGKKATASDAVQGGTVDYATGDVSVSLRTTTALTPVPSVSTSNAYIIEYEWTSANVAVAVVAAPVVQYWVSKNAAGSQVQTDTAAFEGIAIYLGQGVTDSHVPGSVEFSWGGKLYVDRQGKLFRDVDAGTDAGIEAGTIDYVTGRAVLTNWGTTTGGAVAISALLTTAGTLPISYVVFRAPGSPLRTGSLYVQAVRVDTGELISGVSTATNEISGVAMEGRVDHEMGWVEMRFGVYVPAGGNEAEPWYDPANVVGANVFKPVPVNPDTIRFNCVVLTNLPLDADLLGIDPVRLPQNGRVPIVREGDVVVVHEPREYAFPGAVSAGQVVTLPDARVGQLELVDATGVLVPVDQYTADLDAGSVTMANPLSLGALVEPLVANYTVEDMVQVSGVELSGKLALVSPLSRAYAQGAWVSSALLFGDLRAENPFFFSQQTWTNAWSDDRIGSNTTAQYNRTLYPLELVNANAVTERWALIFTSQSGGDIVGETLGQIGTFTTGADVTPTNPVTLQPYFVLRAAGWGAGWAAGNVLRFNTVGPNAPIWIARTVLPGAAAQAEDGFRLQLRGDAD